MTQLNEKLAYWLKTKGKLEAVKNVKDELKCSLFEANKYVETYLKENPGAEVFKASAKTNIITGVVILVVLFLVWKGCSGDDKVQEAVKSGDYMADTSNMKLNAYTYVQEYVKSILKSPGSADFPTRSYEEAISRINTKDSTYFMAGYVDSQNGFGALLRTNFVITLKYLGGDPNITGSWRVHDFTTD